MQFTRRWFQNKFNQIVTFCIRKMQRPLMPSNDCGYITIFHDYEGSYALPGKENASKYGVSRLLDIEKKYNIKATYSVVGKLFDDYPEIIARIIEEGHDLASHSYDHKVISNLSKKQIDVDIKMSRIVFQKFGLQLQGFRSPQSRWNFALIRSMLDNDLKWSAENDRADYPYFIYKKGQKNVIRFPIKMDDWEYISKKESPKQMFKKFENKINEIEIKKSYGAIGFHPWVQGEDENRIFTFEKFISKLKSSNLKIITFRELYKILI